MLFFTTTIAWRTFRKMISISLLSYSKNWISLRRETSRLISMLVSLYVNWMCWQATNFSPKGWNWEKDWDVCLLWPAMCRLLKYGSLSLSGNRIIWFSRQLNIWRRNIRKWSLFWWPKMWICVWRPVLSDFFVRIISQIRSWMWMSLKNPMKYLKM